MLLAIELDYVVKLKARVLCTIETFTDCLSLDLNRVKLVFVCESVKTLHFHKQRRYLLCAQSA